MPPATGFATLPLRTDRGVPEWDETDRFSVQAYFDDVQRLITQYNVADIMEQKKAAAMYVPVEIRQLWSTYASYRDQAKTFKDFRNDVLQYYLGNDKNQFTLSDYHRLVTRLSIGYLQIDLDLFHRYLDL
ncbi:hypothetical protein L227DRAFT_610494 [Lentinus tigrinus ALCF2SS1-6]|uniref:Uncharacterized protein n=1 Tax=Lentinus tigrinus ALCF2SS1-6 TaxID=1328759 RepID=A0A5C2SCF6_9APHY|nr:hypothetical protein L227DRAFT_610494 [Lentinus tigrinus ALCF2SS1-6]